jgi:hypothetical protein
MPQPTPGFSRVVTFKKKTPRAEMMPAPFSVHLAFAGQKDQPGRLTLASFLAAYHGLAMV